MNEPLWGGVDAGGTSFKCLVASGPDAIAAEAEIPTDEPAATLAQVRTFFEVFGPDRLAGVGVASFGPVNVRPGSPDYGRILTTPKAGWSGVNMLDAFHQLGSPLAIDTDVNAAARAERRWGAGQGVLLLAYLTVGTGVGLGFAGGSGGGLMHPEAGHLPPRRHPDDRFEGACPFHGDCLEGLSSGPAMAARWGAPPERLDAEHPAWAMEAWYVAQAVAAAVLVAGADRVVLGGGVGAHPGLVGRVRREFRSLIGAYDSALKARGGADAIVIGAALGRRAGALGGVATIIDAL